MKTIEINGQKYDLEFTFAAADEKGLVQSMFKVVSGAYFFDNSNANTSMAAAMINGTSEMVADLPHISKLAFYAGLKEHNADITYDTAVELMKAYMKENKLSFNAMFQLLKTQMEEDGFFDLTGIVEMMEAMNKDEKEPEKPAKQSKIPKDHLKKSTGTK